MSDVEQYRASNFLKKKEKNDLDQYRATNFRKKEEPKKGFLERAANDVEEHINKPIESLGRSARDVAAGWGQGLANIVPGLYNLGATGANALGANAPKSPMIDLAPHNTSAGAGELASFFAGPGFLKALTKIPGISHTANHAMKIPMIAEGVKHASNILGKSPVASRIAGNAVLGGAYAPENPLAGLALGAAGGAAGEVVAKGYSGIKNSVKKNAFLNNQYQKFNPTDKAKEIEHYLSGGTNNITKNSHELTKDIRNAYENRLAESNIYYDYALKAAGKNKIYDTPSMILNETDKSLGTMNKIQGLNVGDVFNKFKKNPTFENAHRLQSDLGAMARKLEGNLSKNQSDLNEIAKIKSAQSSLQDDITTYLKKHDKTSNNPILGKYQTASELFGKHVVPYLENNKILEITKGGKTDIKDLHNVFNTPSNLIDKNGKETLGNINKILEDLPESAKNRILFNAIGGNKLTPNQLMKKLDDVRSKGYSSYFTPEVEEGINALSKRLKNVKRAKTTGKVIGSGASAGSLIGAAHLLKG